MRKLAAIAIACAAGLAFAHSAKANSTVVVTNGNLDGWSFDTRTAPNYDVDPSLVTGGFVSGPVNGPTAPNGPGGPPLGTGSAELTTPAGGGEQDPELRNSNYNGVALSQLTSLSYATYSAVNNGSQFPFFGLVITTGAGAAGTRAAGVASSTDAIFFEPPYQTPATGTSDALDQGPEVMDEWQSWNILGGAFWDNNGFFNPGENEPGIRQGVGSLADYLALFPDATIENTVDDNGVPLGGIRIDVGEASSGDNFDGFVDDVTVGVSGVNTTFDFEAAAATAVPLPATALTGGILLLSTMGVYGIRRKKVQVALSV